MNNEIKTKLQSIHNSLQNKIGLLESYSAGMSRMLQELKDDQIDNLEVYTEEHDGIIDLLKETEREIDALVHSLNPESAEVVRLIFSNRLRLSDCPDWAKDLMQVFSSLAPCVKRCIELNKECSKIISAALENTKKDIAKSNKSSAAYNYYMHSRPNETGILLDIKE